MKNGRWGTDMFWKREPEVYVRIKGAHELKILREWLLHNHPNGTIPEFGAGVRDDIQWVAFLRYQPGLQGTNMNVFDTYTVPRLDVDEVLSPVDFIRKYSKVTPSNVVTHQELKESVQGSTTFPGRVSGKNSMGPVIELMENGWDQGADFIMFWTVYQNQLLSGAITFRFESQEEAMFLWLEIGGLANGYREA